MRYEELTIEGRNAVLEAFRSGKTIDRDAHNTAEHAVGTAHIAVPELIPVFNK